MPLADLDLVHAESGWVMLCHQLLMENLVSYYNPAVTPFQENNSFQAGYSFLSFDRSLNFLNFTRKFDFYSAKDSVSEFRKPRTTAGLSVGIINSGIGNIDGRDNNGLPTGELSTSENQFFIGLANKIF